eukprot:6079203-Pleurochrysis_carterae.AAC.1
MRTHPVRPAYTAIVPTLKTILLSPPSDHTELTHQAAFLFRNRSARLPSAPQCKAASASFAYAARVPRVRCALARPYAWACGRCACGRVGVARARTRNAHTARCAPRSPS